MDTVGNAALIIIAIIAIAAVILFVVVYGTLIGMILMTFVGIAIVSGSFDVGGLAGGAMLILGVFVTVGSIITIFEGDIY